MEDLTLPVLRKNMFGGTQSVGATSIDFSYLQNIRGKDLEDAKGRWQLPVLILIERMLKSELGLFTPTPVRSKIATSFPRESVFSSRIYASLVEAIAVV